MTLDRLRSSCGLASAALLATAALTFAACGSDGTSGAKAPAGSPQNPLPAQPGIDETTGSSKTKEPSYSALLAQQRGEQQSPSSSNACALVTKAQVASISGVALRDPFLAPQGPTCIYRDHAGRMVATISIQVATLAALRRQMDRVQSVDVADRRGYCGIYGRPVLYMPLSEGRVLNVGAECGAAARIARVALPRVVG